jgi:hypothetical protein
MKCFHIWIIVEEYGRKYFRCYRCNEIKERKK